MGWHDVTVHGFAIQGCDDARSHDFLLDIDYIFKWVKPLPPSKYFSFWVAPCTLAFKNVFDMGMMIEPTGDSLTLPEIQGLELVSSGEQEKGVFVYEWHICFHSFGDIRLKSYGFEQIVRAAPVLQNAQVINSEERGSISFSRLPHIKL